MDAVYERACAVLVLEVVRFHKLVHVMQSSGQVILMVASEAQRERVSHTNEKQ